MRILVVDVAADRGGALTVVRSFAQEAGKDTDHEWILVLSAPEVPIAGTVSVVRFRWVKKSWFHRLWFELVVGPRTVRRLKPDMVLSLQNVRMPLVRVPQVIYIHQSLPFASVKFCLRRQPLLWVYQNIIGRMIIWSARGASRIIVQSRWMKVAIAKRAHVDTDRVAVVLPEVPETPAQMRYHDRPSHRRTFFYPASAQSYKNQRMIVEASRILSSQGNSEFRVLLTVTDAELASLGVGEVPSSIEAIGPLAFEDVQATYARSVLLFPSLIESAPLPLYEARAAGCMILHADIDMYEEVVEGYANAHSHAASSSQELADLMLRCMDGSLAYSTQPPTGSHDAAGYGALVRMIADGV